MPRVHVYNLRYITNSSETSENKEPSEVVVKRNSRTFIPSTAVNSTLE
jgi:hypothetical protein